MAVSLLRDLLSLLSLNRNKIREPIYHRFNDKRQSSGYDVCLTEIPDMRMAC